MKKAPRILAALLGVLVLVVVIVYFAFLREPQLEGKALTVVLRGLVSQSDATRKDSAELLGRAGPGVLPVLVEMIEAKDTPFKKSAREFLDDHEWSLPRFAPPAVKRSQAVTAFRALGAAGAPAAPMLARLFQNADTSAPAGLALAGIGGQAILPLVEALDAPDKRLRGNAKMALESLGPQSKDTVPILLEQLKNPKPQVRAIIPHLLGKIGQDVSRVVPKLIESLADADPEVRVGAAAGLGKFGPGAQPAIPALLAASKDSNPRVRDTAGGAVWLINPKAARAAGIDEALIKPMDYRGPGLR